MTHDDMIKKIKIGMKLDAGATVSEIVKIEKKYTNANETTIYALIITNDQGQSIGSLQLHDLVYNRKAITIAGME